MMYGQQIQVAWRKQPVFIIRHTEDSLKNLQTVLPKLSDPNSDNIEEPYKIYHQLEAPVTSIQF